MQLNQIAQYPAYDASAETQWRIGAANSGTSGTASDMSGTSEGWFVKSMRLRLNPGTYTLLTINCAIRYAENASCDAVRFAILGGTTSLAEAVTLSNGLKYVDVTANKENTSSSRNLAGDLGSVTVTLESGKTYWFAVLMHGKSGRTSAHPSIYNMNSAQWVLGDYWYGTVAGAAMPETTASMTYQTAGTGTNPRMCLKFSTANRIVYSIDASAYAGSDAELIVPRPESTHGWIKFGSAVVADGQALTCVLEYDNAGNEGTRTTLALDMGATDRVTFGSANVALASAGAEAGDTFDLGVNVRAGTGTMDLLYLNRTTGQGAQGAADFCTISHAAKNNAAGDGSRGQQYTIATPHSLKLSGTATIASIEVGADMVVLFGDSQIVTTSGRLGAAFPTAFTRDRMFWQAAIAGNRISESVAANHTAGYLRYKHTTNGLGDLCEMRGVLFIIGGFGVNDISQISTTEGDRNIYVAAILHATAEILHDLAVNGNVPILLGLPPYSDGSASTQEAQAIKTQLNPGLQGLAIGSRCAFYNPWWYIVDPDTVYDDVPQADATYNGGLHYIAAGSTLVCDAAVAAYESGVTPAEDNQRDYADSSRLAEAGKALDTTVKDAAIELSDQFGGDMEALMRSLWSTRDKQAFRDTLVDVNRWIAAFTR